MQLTKHWAGTLDDYVIDLGWSPDGTLLAAASASGPVYLFATADGSLRYQLPGHDAGTNCLAWQPARQMPDARSQELEARGQRPEARSQMSDIRGQMSEGGGQRPEAGNQTQEASGQNSEPRTQNSELRTHNPELITQNPEPETRNSKPETSPLLATGGQDGTVKLWDATAGQHTATAKLGPAWVEHLAWRAPRQTSEVRGQRSEVRGRALTSDLRHLTSGLLFAAAGRTLTAVRPDASITHAFKPAPKTISALAMQPAGGSVAAAYFGGVVLWDTDDFIAQKELPYANGIHALVWSPDSRWLVSGNQDPSVHLWIPEQNEELHMSGYETKVKFLSFDHTSRWLTTSGGRDACVWDCTGAGPEGREPVMLPHDAPVCAVKFQNSHGLLATASDDGVVQLWSPERRQPLRATVRMPSAATKLAWSPDDQYLAIGSQKGVVYVLKCEG